MNRPFRYQRSGTSSFTPPLFSLNEIDGVLIQKAQAFLQRRSQRGPVAADLLIAWEQFSDACNPQLRELACRRMVPSGEVDDLVQEAGGEIWKSFLRFKGSSAEELQSWLAVVVYRLVLKPVREQFRHPVTNLSCLCGMEQELVDAHGDAAQFVERQEQSELVRLVLEQLQGILTEVDYRLFVEHHFEGRKVVDIAREVGLNPGQARMRLQRAREKFYDQWISRNGGM